PGGPPAGDDGEVGQGGTLLVDQDAGAAALAAGGENRGDGRAHLLDGGGALGLHLGGLRGGGLRAERGAGDGQGQYQRQAGAGLHGENPQFVGERRGYLLTLASARSRWLPMPSVSGALSTMTRSFCTSLMFRLIGLAPSLRVRLSVSSSLPSPSTRSTTG